MSQFEKKQLVTVLAVLIVIAVIVGGVIISAKQNRAEETAATGTSMTTNDTATDSSNSPATSAAYKDGTYEATGDYTSPGGQEEIAINVTLKDGVITETSAENMAGDGEARGYQDDFIDGYKDLVVGKKIDQVSLSRVSGSSLTSKGFNDAIEQIAQQAKA